MIAVLDLDGVILIYGTTKLAKEVRSCLAYLSLRGHTMAIASFNSRAKEFLQYNKIEHLFKLIYADPLIPKSAMLKQIQLELEANVEEIIFFDDDRENVKECREAGYKVKYVSSRGLLMYDLIDMGL